MAGDAPPPDYALDGLAVPEELDRLHDLLMEAVSDHPGLPAEDVMMLETAAMEVAGNVVQHGKPEGAVTWRFELRVSPERLEARLLDSGQTYAATWTGEMPDLDAESGRGLPLAELTLHELAYAREGGLNVWTMVRHVSVASGQA